MTVTSEGSQNQPSTAEAACFPIEVRLGSPSLKLKLAFIIGLKMVSYNLSVTLIRENALQG